MVKICFMGTGYVGLVSGVCLASLGHDVCCFDIDEAKINHLNNGQIPIYEPGLEFLVNHEVGQGRLRFSSDITDALQKAEAIFIAVGTPQGEDGRANMQYYHEAIKMIAQYGNDKAVIVNKSTVAVGTAQSAQEYLHQHDAHKNFYIVSNPEFLREGMAIDDFLNTDRVVLGFSSDDAEADSHARNIMQQIYQPLRARHIPIVSTNWQTAELIKYSANAFLAVKIAYINQMADLCEKIDANIDDLSYAMGLDKRIGERFLQVSPGYGGSCFPKDTAAIAMIGDDYDVSLDLIKTAISSNDERKINLAHKAHNIINQNEANIAILGLAFKANTDDMRESASITMIEILAQYGHHITLHDPIAIEQAKKHIPASGHMRYCVDLEEALENQDAIIIMTEWQDYRDLKADDFIEKNNQLKLLDFRNIYDKNKMRKAGIAYYALGLSEH
jgi:UDPglucose 6-dehydrogenase